MAGMPAGPELVKPLLQDLGNPSSIYQGLGTTHCTVATLQSILARSQPAEYARLAGELSETGTATLRGGGQVHVQPGDLMVAEGRNPLGDAFQGRDPMEPGIKAIPLADLQSRVQLIEMTPPTASSSPAYLGRVARANFVTA